MAAGYSLLSIIYVSFNLTSIITVILLMLIILKSPSYLTKWTLFQLCLAILGNTAFSILTILNYGDNTLHEAFNQTICIVQQKSMIFFFYPIHLLPNVLVFYLWFGVINLNLNIEKSSLW